MPSHVSGKTKTPRKISNVVDALSNDAEDSIIRSQNSPRVNSWGSTRRYSIDGNPAFQGESSTQEFGRKKNMFRSHVLAVKFALLLRNRAANRRDLDQGDRFSEDVEIALLDDHEFGTTRTVPGTWSPKSDVKALFNDILLSSKVNILLLVIPFATVSGLLGWNASIVFATNFFALIPLALLLGQITEDLILRFGESIGGLLNATFGNVVEMILGFAALSQGLMDVVAASLIGSVLSNLLLVLGCCFFFGGLKHKSQRFNAEGNKAANSLLFLACIGIITPTMARSIYGPDVMSQDTLITLSRFISVVMIGLYACYLFFQLKTHATLFEESSSEASPRGGAIDEPQDEGIVETPTIPAEHGAWSEGESAEDVEIHVDDEAIDIKFEGPQLSLSGALFALTVITLLVTLCSEFLTGALETVSEQTHINKSFLGLIVLPIAGNAAEHFTAVYFAIRNRMDAAAAIAVGSSIQIAVFVLPITVVVGWIIGQNLTLAFDPFAVIVLTLSVILSYFVTSDGYSNWLLGLQLIITYAIVASIFFFEHSV